MSIAPEVTRTLTPVPALSPTAEPDATPEATAAEAPLLPRKPSLARRALDILAPIRPAEIPPTPHHRGTPWEIRLLALLALVGYLVAGYYIRHVLHFAIGDALARTANAKYMLFARDAHFAALGFVWMPIPTVSQLPFMLFLEPMGHAADAGWISTAVWGAGTVLLLGRLARDLRIPRVLTIFFVVAYAANPVIIYYAANGMSEGPLFFFIVLTFIGVLRYLRDGDSAALLATAIGLGGCALDRYEAIPLIFAVGAILLIADLRRKGRHSALVATTLAVLPALGSVFLWFVYMKIIKGSFRAFITDASGNYTTGPPAGGAVAAPVAAPAAPARVPFYQDVANGMDWLQYTIHWCTSFAPALLLLPLLLLPPLRRSAGAVAVIVFAVWLPGVTAYLLRFGGSAGDPRYFSSAIVTATVGVIYLASRLNQRYVRAFVHPLLVLALLLGWATGSDAQYDRVSTNQEGEYRVFDVLRGVVDKGDTRGIVGDAVFASELDNTLKPGEVVMLDVRFTFEVELYSRKPKQFIINNDEDYDKIRSDPYVPGRKIDYLVFPTAGGRGAGYDYAQLVYLADPKQWQQVNLPTTLNLVAYHRLYYDSTPRAPAGSGPEG